MRFVKCRHLTSTKGTMLKSLKQLDQILRGEATRLPALRQGTIEISVRGLAGVLLGLCLAYGLCMGLFAVITRYNAQYYGPEQGWKQMFATTVKVPALLFLTLLVTFPSLYVFNALVGSRLSIKSVLRLLVAAMGVMIAVLASFGTIVAFFSASTTSYPFMVVLNVLVFAVSGFLGLLFLFQTLHRLSLAQEQADVEQISSQQSSAGDVPPPLPQSESGYASPSALDRVEGRVLGPHVSTVFRVWVIVFGLVGAQMGWVLRPFIGNPSKEFTLFRARGSNFFEAVWGHVTNLF